MNDREKALHETKTHGTSTFPYAVYKVIIPDVITSFPLHWHDAMEFIYVAEGRGFVTVFTQRYEVSGGDIVIIPPQTVHSIEGLRGEKMEYYNVLFDFSLLDSAGGACYDRFLKPLYCHAKLPPYFAAAGDALNALLCPHLRYLIENRKAEYCEQELMIRSQLFALVHHVSACAATASSADVSLNNNYDKLKSLLDHIRTHYSDDITVKDAAGLCSYSPSHFMKLFKELTGKSFSQYLIDYRLEKAAAEIAETRDKFVDIATHCGFSGLSYFSRAFSDKYGMTPSEYRKSFRTREE